MEFIKVDIDGAGEKWRLAVLREQGTMFYFPEEDFEDLVENYEDCEKKPVPRPDAMAVVADEVSKAIGRIVDGEIWAGRARCRVCDYTWVACAPFGTNTFECPACGCMEGRKEFNDAEEAAGRIATALVNILGIPAKDAIDAMKGISQVIPEGNIRDKWEESLRFLAMENKG